MAETGNQAPGGVDPVKIVLAGLSQFIAVAAKVITAISDARHYTISEQTLGERFIDQIPGVDQALFDAGLLQHRGAPGLANYVDSHFAEGTGNYGTIIAMAREVMTILFGVRITNDDDLDALDGGAIEYYSRPDKQDIPEAAVNRAVYLKQTFFPISTYNTTPWDMSKFATVPYAAPIPGIEPGTLYNGTIPGGGEIKDGIVTVPGAFTSGGSGGTQTTSANSPGSGSAGAEGGNTGMWIIILAIAALMLLGNDNQSGNS